MFYEASAFNQCFDGRSVLRRWYQEHGPDDEYHCFDRGFDRYLQNGVGRKSDKAWENPNRWPSFVHFHGVGLFCSDVDDGGRGGRGVCPGG